MPIFHHDDKKMHMGLSMIALFLNVRIIKKWAAPPFHLHHMAPLFVMVFSIAFATVMSQMPCQFQP